MGSGNELPPPKERSQTTLAHESARAQRMADFFDDRVTDPLMQCGMTRLIVAVAVDRRQVSPGAKFRSRGFPAVPLPPAVSAWERDDSWLRSCWSDRVRFDCQTARG
jgi:hypothetical protein